MMSKKTISPSNRRRVTHLKSADDMRQLLPYAHPLKWYKPGRKITVSDRMQKNYTYILSARAGRDFAPSFRPQLSPARMLRLGVFEGKYLNDCMFEFPREWFADAIRARKLSPGGADPSCNALRIKSRLSLQKWRKNGWIPTAKGDRDVRGWFQWYCRYWIGRRQPAVDDVQIARWRAFVRHRAQILASYKRMGRSRPRTIAQKKKHRARQRQALLQWAYKPFV